MKTLFIAFKILVNIILLSFYILFSIIFWNFLFWLFLTIFDKVVPWKDDPIHFKIAILVIFLTLVISILFRKFFYLPVFSWIKEIALSKNNSKSDISKINGKIKEPKNDELEIYINKEIK